jgi:enolase-phosphatase E1
LTPHITAFFDTRVGAKSEVESYKKIAVSLSHATRQFLFISDAAKEVEAAQSAGMQALLCGRDSGAASARGQCEAIHSFDNLIPD